MGEPKLERVSVEGLLVCDLCLDGKGGECHVPGCLFWLNRAPDLPLRRKLIEQFGAEIKEWK